MVESVGKKLNQARLQRGLTIDEAAHATKLRPDKIAALESDDYSRFANNTYAKGFLQIYGRFLKVDVDDFARTLDNANPISISDYQYLSNAPAAKNDPEPIRREGRRPPSLAPLLVFVFLIGLGLALAWAYQNYERLQGDSAAKSTPSHDTASPSRPNPDAAFVTDASPAAITPRPATATPQPGVTPGTAPRVASASPGPTPIKPLSAVPPRPGLPTPLSAANPRAATPAPLTSGIPPVKAEQDFVTPVPVPTGDNPTRPGGANEVLVATIKTTHIIVRRDDPKAPPIFEGLIYPHAPPLKLKGPRFFIDVDDPASVQITKNGLPFAYQTGSQPVQ